MKPLTQSDFLRELFPADVPEGTRLQVALVNGGGWSAARFIFARELGELKLPPNRNVYFKPCLVRARDYSPSETGGAGDAVAMPGFFADMDFGKSGDDEEEILEALGSLPIAPNLIVRSGAGLHPYYLFPELYMFEPGDEEAAELRRAFGRWVSKPFAEKSRSVDPTFDLARQMRLPGSLNLKHSPPRPVEAILDEHGERVPLKVWKLLLAPFMGEGPSSPPTQKERRHREEPSPVEPLKVDDEVIIRMAREAANGPEFSALFDEGNLSAYGEDRNRADLALCRLLAFYTQDVGQIERLFNESALCREKWERRADYRERTISLALDSLEETYGDGDDEEEEEEKGMTTKDTSRRWKAREELTLGAHSEVVQFIGPAGGVGTLTAPSGTGKSFLLYALADAVGRGEDFFDLKTKQGSVVYLPFEGDNVALRVAAFEQEAGREMENFYVLPGLGPLNGDDGRKEVEAQLKSLREHLLERALPPVRLVLVDTLRASMDGDENSSADTSEYISALRQIQKAVFPEAFALVTHHSGWLDGEGAKRRERGSSAVRGNVETSLWLEVEGEPADIVDLSWGYPIAIDAGGEAITWTAVPLTLSFLKVRDARSPAPIRLLRKEVDLEGEFGEEADQWGEPLRSCVVVADPRSPEEIEAAREEGKARAKDGELEELTERLVSAVREGEEIRNAKEAGELLGVNQKKATEVLKRADGRLWKPGRGQPYKEV